MSRLTYPPYTRSIRFCFSCSFSFSHLRSQVRSGQARQQCKSSIFVSKPKHADARHLSRGNAVSWYCFRVGICLIFPRDFFYYHHHQSAVIIPEWSEGCICTVCDILLCSALCCVFYSLSSWRMIRSMVCMCDLHHIISGSAHVVMSRCRSKWMVRSKKAKISRGILFLWVATLRDCLFCFLCPDDLSGVGFPG